MVKQQAITHQKTILLQIPLQYLYMVLPVTGVLLVIRSLQVIYEDFFKKEEVKEIKKD